MIVIAGGNGFLGRPLAATLAAEGHEITVLTRTVRDRASEPDPARAARGVIRQVEWTPDGSVGAWRRVIDGAAAVINLAGESIAARRWSVTQKTRLVDSRLRATRSLVDAINGASKPPAVLVSASAIGYYGDRANDVLTEQSAPGNDFLADLAVRWEQEAMRVASDHSRVACIRTGIVLDPNGGALRSMLPPFKAFAGGPLGSGRQYMSWIHRSDWLSLVRWVIGHDMVDGPINATAPNPVTNTEFSRALGRALHRPSLLPAPAFALRLLLGEMAEPLLLASQRVLPARAQALGFEFAYPTLAPALEALFAG